MIGICLHPTNSIGSMGIHFNFFTQRFPAHRAKVSRCSLNSASVFSDTVQEAFRAKLVTTFGFRPRRSELVTANGAVLRCL